MPFTPRRMREPNCRPRLPPAPLDPPSSPTPRSLGACSASLSARLSDPNCSYASGVRRPELRALRSGGAGPDEHLHGPRVPPLRSPAGSRSRRGRRLPAEMSSPPARCAAPVPGPNARRMPNRLFTRTLDFPNLMGVRCDQAPFVFTKTHRRRSSCRQSALQRIALAIDAAYKVPSSSAASTTSVLPSPLRSYGAEPNASCGWLRFDCLKLAWSASSQCRCGRRCSGQPDPFSSSSCPICCR